MLTSRQRVEARSERGVMTLLFALLLPMILALGALVITVGSWYTHARHLQTKVDASALAGGDVWAFPCVETAPVGQLTSSQTIIDAARQYVGAHTQADTTTYNSTFNPQVGGVTSDKIHVVLNGTDYWTDTSSPPDYMDPPGTTPGDPGTNGAGTVCASNHLDVKATEDDSANLFRYLPFSPDIKRKARVEIHQIEGLDGILPIGVKVPKPLSAAAVFYNEMTGTILGGLDAQGDSLGIKYFCSLKTPPVGFGIPVGSGLDAWTTYDTSDPTCSYTSWASLSITDHTGVVVASSFRPRCDATASPPVTTNCLSRAFTNVDNFCHQGSGRIAQCYYTTGSGTSQVAQSGLQFIRGYTSRTVQNGGASPTFWSSPPQVNSVWLDTPSAPCGGAFSATSAYFNDPNQACTAALNADIDFGDALDQTKHPGAGAEVRYGQVYGTTVANGEERCVGGSQSFTGGNNVPNCNMTVSGSGAFGSVLLDPRFDSNGDPTAIRHSFVMMIQLTNTRISTDGGATKVNCPSSGGATCRWFYWADNGPQDQGSWPTRTANVDTLVFTNPLQRSFTGSPDVNGPVRWLRLTGVNNGGSGCGGAAVSDGTAASQTKAGTDCFAINMGLKGALAQDQSEPAFGFNVKGSQSGAVDCDPNLTQWKDETEQGCSPFYKSNDFSSDPPCPWPDGTQRNWGQFIGLQGATQAPTSAWPAYNCLRSDGPPAAGQVDNGLKGRMFTPPADKLALNFTGESATTCPPDSATDFVPGRNYWSDSNNASGGKYAFANLSGPTPHGNKLVKGRDPRLVNLFMTTYNSFGGSGSGEVYPIVNFGSFYITGWGSVNGSNGINIDDPCPGNAPPPDMVVVTGGSGAEYIWGHFINNVIPSGSASPDPNKLCNPALFDPCIPVLVQ
jgi:hypothetical protein